MTDVFVIMNKGEVYDSKFFEKLEYGRNYIKMKFPKRRFKERIENEFVCTLTGMKFKIVEINNAKSLEAKLRDGINKDMESYSY